LSSHALDARSTGHASEALVALVAHAVDTNVVEDLSTESVVTTLIVSTIVGHNAFESALLGGQVSELGVTGGVELVDDVGKVVSHHHADGVDTVLETTSL
jgi:hypothetical protein